MFSLFVCLDAVYVIQSGGEAECQKQHTYKQTNKQHKQTQEDDDEMDGRMICSSWNDRLTQDNRADTKSQVGKRKRRWRKGWTERWQGFDGEDVILAGRCLKQLFAPVCVCVASLCLLSDLCSYRWSDVSGEGIRTRENDGEEGRGDSGNPTSSFQSG